LPLVAIKVGKSFLKLPIFGHIEVGLFYPLLLVPLGVTGAANAVNMLAGFNGLEAGKYTAYFSDREDCGPKDTVIVYDPLTKKSAIVAATKQNLRAIESGRKRTVYKRNIAEQQKQLTGTLKKAGLEIASAKDGVVIYKDRQSRPRKVVLSERGVLAEESGGKRLGSFTTAKYDEQRINQMLRNRKFFNIIKNYADDKKISFANARKRIVKKLKKSLGERGRLLSLPPSIRERWLKENMLIIFGSPPQKDAAVKRLKDLTPAEAEKFIKAGIESISGFSLMDILGKGSEESYKKFKVNKPATKLIKTGKTWLLPTKGEAEKRRKYLVKLLNSIGTFFSKTAPRGMVKSFLGAIDITKANISNEKSFKNKKNELKDLRNSIVNLGLAYDAKIQLQKNPDNKSAQNKFKTALLRWQLLNKSLTDKQKKIFATENAKYLKDILNTIVSGTVTVTRGFVSFLYKGLNDLSNAAMYELRDKVKISNAYASFLDMAKLTKSIKKLEQKIEKNQKITKEDIYEAKKYRGKIKKVYKDMKSGVYSKKAKELANTQEAKAVKILTAIIAGTYLAGAVTATYATAASAGKLTTGLKVANIIAKGTLTTVKLINAGYVANAARKVIEKPSERNIGEFVFYTLPEAARLVKILGKLRTTNLANIKNAEIVKRGLKEQVKVLNKIISRARKLKDSVTLNNNLKWK